MSGQGDDEMADDKKKQRARDRAQVASGEPYEVGYFANKHGITHEEAQGLIDRLGNDRKKLDSAAAKAARSSVATTTRSKPAAKNPARTTNASPAKGSNAPASKPAAKRSGAASKSPADAAMATAGSDTLAPTVHPSRAAANALMRNAKPTTQAAEQSIANAPSTVRKAVATAVGVTSAVTGGAAGLVGMAAAGVATGLAANLARKVIVQAPTALAGDWLEALKVKHRMALAIVDLLQATNDEDTGRRTTLLAQLKHALGKHSFTEENVIYPALRAWGDTADADKLTHDHGYVKQYLYDLEEMNNASPAFLAKVAAFRTHLEEHIHEEEPAIFPPFHAGLGTAGNAKGTALANREGFKLA
jgi:iron-sulfur cluster repair protein YtfE (RIC family)